jgi:hypothetical protein
MELDRFFGNIVTKGEKSLAFVVLQASGFVVYLPRKW